MAASRRNIWNGAISFGLVNIPVGLHTATDESGLDFDWLDKRTMDPVGYKRINKKTGEEISSENIVKGIAYEKGRYIILSDDEIRQALPKSTQTIEIEAFVSAAEIPLVYFERPYYLAPTKNADKAYALLREALLKTKRVGIARVVLHTKQHLAAIVPTGPALVLFLLRWAEHIRPLAEVEFPPAGEAGMTDRESSIAAQLVDAMSEPWDPDKFRDSFTAEVMALVEEKVKTGHIETVRSAEAEAEIAAMDNVVDFTELLRRSLQIKKASRSQKPSPKTKRKARGVSAGPD
jgi:DNA end-binding protein Ku